METKRVVGPQVWSSLYQQSPITGENQLFSPSWFKYRDASEVDALNTRNFLTIDTAISEKGDFTGFCDNRVDNQNFWNLQAWRERLNPQDLLDKLFFLHHNARYEKIGIEKTMYSQVIQPFLEEEMRKRNTFLPIVELHHNQKKKEERIKWLVPRYSSGAIYHIRGRTADLEEELISFPKAKNDDVSDAVAYQVQIAEASGESDWGAEDLDFNTDW
jgi:phage terminase large subunit-like protein